MSPADQVLVRLHRQEGGTVLGHVEWPPVVVEQLVADGLVALDPATRRPRLTDAGVTAARRLTEPAGADGIATRPPVQVRS